MGFETLSKAGTGQWNSMPEEPKKNRSQIAKEPARARRGEQNGPSGEAECGRGFGNPWTGGETENSSPLKNSQEENKPCKKKKKKCLQRLHRQPLPTGGF